MAHHIICINFIKSLIHVSANKNVKFTRFMFLIELVNKLHNFTFCIKLGRRNIFMYSVLIMNSTLASMIALSNLIHITLIRWVRSVASWCFSYLSEFALEINIILLLFNIIICLSMDCNIGNKFKSITIDYS